MFKATGSGSSSYSDSAEDRYTLDVIEACHFWAARAMIRESELRGGSMSWHAAYRHSMWTWDGLFSHVFEGLERLPRLKKEYYRKVGPMLVRSGQDMARHREDRDVWHAAWGVIYWSSDQSRDVLVEALPSWNGPDDGLTSAMNVSLFETRNKGFDEWGVSR